MKKFLQLLLLCAVTSTYAQLTPSAPWMEHVNQNTRTDRLTFQEIVEQANAYFETIDKDAKGSGYKPFKRWEAYWENFVGEDGYLPTKLELWNSWLEIQARSQNRSTQVDDSNWISIGPTDFLNRPTSTANIGRVNVIIQDPNNPNTYYAGAPAGGIWKSTDAGSTWTPLVDHLPQIGVSGIAIDHNDSNTIYIATGDDDASHSITIGVWKSTDGGLTWAETGLNANNSPSSMNDIYIHPTDSNILWVATSQGIYKTTDAGANWNLSQAGNMRDIKIKPGDPNTIYAVTSSNFYRSTDGGDSFTLSNTGLPGSSGRLVIDVTPADPNYVYVVSAATNNGYQGIYRSTDSGATFTQRANTTNIFESTQAWYDLALAVSDTDADEIYVGVLNIWKSSNGGDSFTQLNQWFSHNAAYTHADIHFLRFYSNELYVGSDGGFFKSNNGGTTFTDYTEGMEISQFYRIDVSQQTANKIVGGTQDNGGFGYFNQWNNYHGGDGMEGVIDPNNDNLYYGFMQNGDNLFVSNDSGQSGSSAFPGPESGNWITPLAINSDSEVYAGYNSLYQFTGSGWTAVSSSFGTRIDRLEIDPANPDNVYVAINNTLRKSTDRGQNFTNVETFPSNITSIEVNKANNDIVYVTVSGFNAEVYRSIDGGQTFSTITGSLPSVAKNIIIHRENDPLNTLYLGTHAGIYFYNDTTADWEEFNNNLPNVSIRDLAINLPDETIVAGTFGRGIWTSPLAPTLLADDDIRLVAITAPNSLSINCGAFTPQITVKNNGNNTINGFDINYAIDNGATSTMNWPGTLASQESVQIDLPEMTLPTGEHSLNVEVTIPVDTFLANNTSLLTFTVNEAGVNEVTNTFETEDQSLLIFTDQGNPNLWERGVPASNDLNTAQSGTQVYGTNLDGNYFNNSRSYLVSRCFDLTALTNPYIRFYLAYEIEENWDVFYVEYTLDQGTTWNLLGSANDPNWYNSDRFAGDGVANNCNLCVGGQWTGSDTTMQQYELSLNTFTNESNIMFRFVFQSDGGVVGEGVNIDDLVIEGTLSTEEFEFNDVTVYPNPSNNIFNVQMSRELSDLNYTVTDLSGKVVLQQRGLNGTQHQIDMSQHSAGIYFLRLNSSGGSITKKLILK